MRVGQCDSKERISTSSYMTRADMPRYNMNYSFCNRLGADARSCAGIRG